MSDTFPVATHAVTFVGVDRHGVGGMVTSVATGCVLSSTGGRIVGTVLSSSGQGRTVAHPGNCEHGGLGGRDGRFPQTLGTQED